MNRADLLSIYGIAREVAALFDGELLPVAGDDPADRAAEPVDVTIEDPEGCPRYIGRLFRDVPVGPSPMWLRARLHAAGMRPISNVVDVTNYVMLVLREPAARVRPREARRRPDRRAPRHGRRGADARSTATLREARRARPVIADAERAVALAGIMGGRGDRGRRRDDRGAARGGELRADRDPPDVRAARACAPRARTAGRRASTRTSPSRPPCSRAGCSSSSPAPSWTGGADVHGGLPERPVVRLRPERTDRIVGLDVEPERAAEILERLGFEVDGDWDVTVPTWRARDVTREIDLVEEVARVVLDRVPFTLPLRRAVAGHLTREQRLRRLVEDVLVGAGFSRGVHVEPRRATTPTRDALRLPEPMSGEQAVLRTTLLDGLVEAARAQRRRRATTSIALFEVARVYLPERRGSCRTSAGASAASSRAASRRAKGAVEALYEALHLELRLGADDAAVPPPGQGGGDGGRLGRRAAPGAARGRVGRVRARPRRRCSAPIPERVLYDDVITLSRRSGRTSRSSSPRTSRPARSSTPRSRPAAPELREVRVFDVYRGEQVGEGRKSVAIHVAFQSPERTLSDEDAAVVRERIVAALARAFGAELRG